MKKLLSIIPVLSLLLSIGSVATAQGTWDTSGGPGSYILTNGTSTNWGDPTGPQGRFIRTLGVGNGTANDDANAMNTLIIESGTTLNLTGQPRDGITIAGGTVTIDGICNYENTSLDMKSAIAVNTTDSIVNVNGVINASKTGGTEYVAGISSNRWVNTSIDVVIGDLSGTINVTTNDAALFGYGIHAKELVDIENFSGTINISGDGRAIGIMTNHRTGGTNREVDIENFTGKISAVGGGADGSVGIFSYEAINIENFTGSLDAGGNVVNGIYAESTSSDRVNGIYAGTDVTINNFAGPIIVTAPGAQSHGIWAANNLSLGTPANGASGTIAATTPIGTDATAVRGQALLTAYFDGITLGSYGTIKNYLIRGSDNADRVEFLGGTNILDCATGSTLEGIYLQNGNDTVVIHSGASLIPDAASENKTGSLTLGGADDTLTIEAGGGGQVTLTGGINFGLGNETFILGGGDLTGTATLNTSSVVFTDTLALHLRGGTASNAEINFTPVTGGVTFTGNTLDFTGGGADSSTKFTGRANFADLAVANTLQFVPGTGSSTLDLSALTFNSDVDTSLDAGTDIINFDAAATADLTTTILGNIHLTAATGETTTIDCSGVTVASTLDFQDGLTWDGDTTIDVTGGTALATVGGFLFRSGLDQTLEFTGGNANTKVDNLLFDDGAHSVKVDAYNGSIGRKVLIGTADITFLSNNTFDSVELYEAGKDSTFNRGAFVIAANMINVHPEAASYSVDFVTLGLGDSVTSVTLLDDTKISVENDGIGDITNFYGTSGDNELTLNDTANVLDLSAFGVDFATSSTGTDNDVLAFTLNAGTTVTMPGALPFNLSTSTMRLGGDFAYTSDFVNDVMGANGLKGLTVTAGSALTINIVCADPTAANPVTSGGITLSGTTTVDAADLNVQLTNVTGYSGTSIDFTVLDGTALQTNGLVDWTDADLTTLAGNTTHDGDPNYTVIYTQANGDLLGRFFLGTPVPVPGGSDVITNPEALDAIRNASLPAGSATEEIRNQMYGKTEEQQDNLIQQFTPSASFAFASVTNTALQQLVFHVDSHLEANPAFTRVASRGNNSRQRGQQLLYPHRSFGYGPQELVRYPRTWFNTFGYTVNQPSKEGFIGYKNNGWGFLGGVDQTFGILNVGLAYGYSNNTMESRPMILNAGPPQSGLITTHSMIFYGTLPVSEVVSIKGQAGWNWGLVNGTRNRGTGLSNAKFETSTSTGFLKVELDYHAYTGTFLTLTPKLGYGYFGYTQDGYTEENGFDVQRYNHSYSNLDFLMSSQFAVNESLFLDTTLGYRRMLNASGVVVGASADGLSYLVNGITPAEDLFVYDLGARCQLDNNLQIQVEYNLRYGTGRTEYHGGRASATLEF